MLALIIVRDYGSHEQSLIVDVVVYLALCCYALVPLVTVVVVAVAVDVAVAAVVDVFSCWRCCRYYCCREFETTPVKAGPFKFFPLKVRI